MRKKQSLLDNVKKTVHENPSILSSWTLREERGPLQLSNFFVINFLRKVVLSLEPGRGLIGFIRIGAF